MYQVYDTKVNYRCLSFIKEYNTYELPSEYDTGDEDNSKTSFQTFKLLKRMVGYKWEVGEYFATNKDIQEGIRTHVIHSRRNLKFKKMITRG